MKRALVAAALVVVAAGLPPAARADIDEPFALCPSGRTGIASAVTSCAFADSVRAAWLAQEGPIIQAYSPVTGQIYTMQCVGPIATNLGDADRCVGGNNAVVVVLY
jgi:hypothetical protein